MRPSAGRLLRAEQLLDRSRSQELACPTLYGPVETRPPAIKVANAGTVSARWRVARSSHLLNAPLNTLFLARRAEATKPTTSLPLVASAIQRDTSANGRFPLRSSSRWFDSELPKASGTLTIKSDCGSRDCRKLAVPVNGRRVVPPPSSNFQSLERFAWCLVRSHK